MTMPYKAQTYKPQNHKPSSVKRPEWRRFYGRKWAAYRKAFLSRAENAFCVRCLTIGRETPAGEVDHIKPHRGDINLFWDSDNHQPLCKRCHSIKTVKEDGGFGRPPGKRSS